MTSNYDKHSSGDTADGGNDYQCSNKIHLVSVDVDVVENDQTAGDDAADGEGHESQGVLVVGRAVERVVQPVLGSDAEEGRSGGAGRVGGVHALGRRSARRDQGAGREVCVPHLGLVGGARATRFSQPAAWL